MTQSSLDVVFEHGRWVETKRANVEFHSPSFFLAFPAARKGCRPAAGHRPLGRGRASTRTTPCRPVPQQSVLTKWLRQPGDWTFDALRTIRKFDPDLLSNWMHTSAVSAIREGAEDYLPKPFTDDELNHKSLRQKLKPGDRRSSE